VILVALAVSEGVIHQVFSLTVLGAHVRLLLAIPLFFLAESWLEDHGRVFARMIVGSGVVPEDRVSEFSSIVRSTARLKDSWVPEGILLVVVGFLPLMAVETRLLGESAIIGSNQVLAGLTLVGGSYWVVCLMLFRFLIGRWVWRMALWCYFLWRLARMELKLVPTHPDGVGGLGYLEVVHAQFTPLVVAISAVLAGMLADGVASGRVSLEEVSPTLIWVLLLDSVLFLGPLTLFAPRLVACRLKGLANYTALATRYVTLFDRKWLGPDAPDDEAVLGTADLQSLADLSVSVENVRRMRWAPASLRLVITLALAALLPLLPLVFLQYPLGDLASQLFRSLLGL
jgi:hypothetical protein